MASVHNEEGSATFIDQSSRAGACPTGNGIHMPRDSIGRHYGQDLSRTPAWSEPMNVGPRSTLGDSRPWTDSSARDRPLLPEAVPKSRYNNEEYKLHCTESRESRESNYICEMRHQAFGSATDHCTPISRGDARGNYPYLGQVDSSPVEYHHDHHGYHNYGTSCDWNKHMFDYDTNNGGQQSRRMLRKEVPPPTFDGINGSFPEFVEDFTRTADYNGWDNDDRKFHLWNCITGNAKIRVKTIPYSANYLDLLSRLWPVFDNERSLESCRNQLAFAKRDANMDLETYGHYLLDLVRKAHPRAEQEEQERITLDHFVKSAGSHNMYVWLRAYRPKTVIDAIDMAIHFEQATALNCHRKPRIEVAKCEFPLTNLFVKQVDDLPTQVATAKPNFPASPAGNRWQEQLKVISDQVEALTKKLNCENSKIKQAPVFNFGCDQPGYTKRTYPNVKRGVGQELGPNTAHRVGAVTAAPGAISHRKRKGFLCTACPRAFGDVRRLFAHWESAHCHSYMGYTCPTCLHPFHKEHHNLMKQHLKHSHGIPAEEYSRVLSQLRVEVVTCTQSDGKAEIVCAPKAIVRLLAASRRRQSGKSSIPSIARQLPARPRPCSVNVAAVCLQATSRGRQSRKSSTPSIARHLPARPCSSRETVSGAHQSLQRWKPKLTADRDLSIGGADKWTRSHQNVRRRHQLGKTYRKMSRSNRTQGLRKSAERTVDYAKISKINRTNC